MWRFWRELPRHGRIGLFLGGLFQSVLAEQVDRGDTDGPLRRQLEHLASFERMLVDDGVLILKFWMHLPRKELRKRLKRAKKRSDWRWMCS